MARFNTIMIETGTVTVADGGTATVTLESSFTGTPTIYATAGPASTIADPGGAVLPSFNANTYVTGLSNTAGSWAFTVNTQEIHPFNAQSGASKTAHGTYTNIQIVWRAVGPVSAT